MLVGKGSRQNNSLAIAKVCAVCPGDAYKRQQTSSLAPVVASLQCGANPLIQQLMSCW